MLKKVIEIRHKIKPREDVDTLNLRFLLVTIYGKRFVALVDMGAIHSFLSRKETRYFKKKVEMGTESSAFKAVNSSMKVVIVVSKDTQVRVSSWFGKLDLGVVDLDDHIMVLGKYILKAT